MTWRPKRRLVYARWALFPDLGFRPNKVCTLRRSYRSNVPANYQGQDSNQNKHATSLPTPDEAQKGTIKRILQGQKGEHYPVALIFVDGECVWKHDPGNSRAFVSAKDLCGNQAEQDKTDNQSNHCSN